MPDAQDVKGGMLETLLALLVGEDRMAEGAGLKNEQIDARVKQGLGAAKNNLSTIFAKNPWWGNARKNSPEDDAYILMIRKHFEEQQLIQEALRRQQQSQIADQFNPGVVPARFR
jgi:hypothetical protein